MPVKLIRLALRIRNRRISRKFRVAQVKIYEETDQYVLKTADTLKEVRFALKMRHAVFYEELLGSKKRGRLDVDRFDKLADHLIIQEKQTGRMIGTYRIICSQFSKRFYSQSEFNLKNLLKLPGCKIELGRACIHKDHRNGSVMNLLWRGIALYIQKTDAKYLFGCTSFKTGSIEKIFSVHEWLKSTERLDDRFGVYPLRKFRPEKCGQKWPRTSPAELESADLPPLFLSYIRAGAVVSGRPAWDPDFKCFDFLTILEIENMTPSFKRRYGF